MTIEKEDLVPGDILPLSPGESIAADCLILEASHLQVSQSTLTGESEPVRKAAIPEGEKEENSLFELENIVFMGTNVISGSALALVLRTGDGKAWDALYYLEGGGRWHLKPFTDCV